MVVIDLIRARKDLRKVIEQVLNNETAVITSEKGNVVMISESNWEGIKETLYLMSDPDFPNDILEARSTPLSEREIWNPHVCPARIPDRL